MAVVRLKYIRGKQQIKAHLRYITHRRGETQEKITRLLFGREGLTDKQSVYQMIDNAKQGTAFFKIMISPDPKREDTHKDLDLQYITRQTLLKLEKLLGRHFQFVATIHNDHRPHRHVHGIFLLQGRLSKEKFRALQDTAYKTATHSARLQRKVLDRVREHPRYRTLNRYHAHTQSVSVQRPGRFHSNRFVFSQHAALADMGNSQGFHTTCRTVLIAQLGPSGIGQQARDWRCSYNNGSIAIALSCAFKPDCCLFLP